MNNDKMKVKIYSHVSDIDGLGAIVLGNTAFGNVDMQLCDYTSINDIIKEDYINGSFDNYDKIYIVDICVSTKIAELLDVDDDIHDKLLLLDHHQTGIDLGMNHFDFINISTHLNGRPTCGTELFYKHLVQNGLLKPNHAIKEFVELTRRHDTWEWKTVYNDEKANDLATYLTATWKTNYIAKMTQKLWRFPNSFEFSPEEQEVITNYKNSITEKFAKSVKNMQYTTVDNLKFGIGFINHEYRNDLAQFVRDINHPIDVLLIPNVNKNTCSLRNISPDVDVRKIAEVYGGGGHPGAASCKLSPSFIRDFNIKLPKNANHQENNENNQ